MKIFFITVAITLAGVGAAVRFSDADKVLQLVTFAALVTLAGIGAMLFFLVASRR